jgi:pimeloyl-ACP methyl ester carboxylesterase
VWKHQAAYFAGRVPVLVVDLIGHGRSDAPKTNYSFATMARSIDAVMRDAGVERAVLVGHSNGMPTIREFYRLFPTKTLALVDVDGTLRPFFRDAKEAEPFLAMFRSPKYKETVEQFIRQTFSPKLPEDSQQKILATALATPQHVLIGTMQANLDPEVWKDDPIQVPFLLLLAKQEFWEGNYQQYVMKLAPHAEWHMDDGLGHFIQLETPDTVNSRIAAFLASNHLL